MVWKDVEGEPRASIIGETCWGVLRGLETFTQLVYSTKENGYLVNNLNKYFIIFTCSFFTIGEKTTNRKCQITNVKKSFNVGFFRRNERFIIKSFVKSFKQKFFCSPLKSFYSQQKEVLESYC